MGMSDMKSAQEGSGLFVISHATVPLSTEFTLDSCGVGNSNLWD